MGYGLDDRGDGVRFQAGARDSLQTGSGAHAASYTMGTGSCFPGEKWQKHEADHSPPTSPYVNNGEAIPPLSHMSHGVELNY
jgi:hypothetical protein